MTAESTTDTHTALREQFGFPEFRPGQETALAHVLAGRDTLVVMPTGSGKSLIYQLAALLLPGTALVISPLVALMKDQVDSLARRGIAAAFVNSSLTLAEQQQRLRSLAAGEYKILLVAPERLRSQAFRGAMASAALSLLVVDEAHCLSQWGHDFRPDYLQIAAARRDFRAPITLALTATATPRVQADIVRLLGLDGAERLVTGFNRPNLTFEVLPAPDARAKLRRLRAILAEADGAGIVYVGTRREAEEVAQFARDTCGIRQARHYHGALDAATRTQTQDAFMAGDVPLVVATNAFGMGIDRPDVRFVLHYSLPGSLEAYYQEAGRAGRDGLPARAILLYSARDTGLHEFFMENDAPTPAELRQVHAYLSDLPSVEFDGEAAQVRLSPEDLESATGLARTRLRVALDQLQAAGIVDRASGEAYGMLSLTVRPLDPAGLQAAARQMAARQQVKRDQLEKMVAYAETTECRRRTLLTHFGDDSAPEAEVCCDNCLAGLRAPAAARPAESRAERAALIALDAVARLNWDVGKGKLVQMLKGSTSAEMARYRRSPYFGKFSALPASEIDGLVSQLIEAGYLRQAGGRLPTLKLSPKGESALVNKSAITVDLSASQAPAGRREPSVGPPGTTVVTTGQMLAQGLRPEEIAATRALTVSTVYSHLAQLISSGQVHVNAVVPPAVQQAIRSAIETVGSVEYLSPLKQRLPEEIDYNVIRCVVNAWLREHGQAQPGAARPAASEAPRRELADPRDAALFERLRAWRRETAVAAGVAAFVVFPDAALVEIAAARPRNAQALLALRGVGPAKVEKYGAAVLDLIATSEP